MCKNPQWWTRLSVLTILSMCPLFVACGDEEDDEADSGSSARSGSNAGAGLYCFAYLLVSGDDECLSYLVSSSSSGGSGGSGSSSGSGDVIVFMPIDEYEPNDDWLNANPVEFPRTTDRDGFIVDGDVHDVVDQADVFTFTRTFLRYYAFRLCSEGQKYCGRSGEIDSLSAYIDILDQSGRVVASSQASDDNFLRLQLSGGVPVYVRVVAGDTMAASIRYHLVVHEANY